MIYGNLGINDDSAKSRNGAIKINKNKSDLLKSIGNGNRSKKPSLSRSSIKQIDDQVIRMNDIIKSKIGKNDKSTKKIISNQFLLSPSVKRYLREIIRTDG